MTVLVIHNEFAIQLVLGTLLREWGYEVVIAPTGEEAEQFDDATGPDIVITDVAGAGRAGLNSGLEWISSLKAKNPARPIILIAAPSSIGLALEAMKRGAYQFVTTPLDYERLRDILLAAQKQVMVSAPASISMASLKSAHSMGYGGFIGTAARMRDVYVLLESLSESNVSALISGETGTGKEVAARTIHACSSRSRGPFIAINAAAVPETLIESELFGHEKGAFTGATALRPGCFELAQGGTLLIDEIAEMPMALQPKLLRVLEGGRFRRLGGSKELVSDARVIAATNRDPSEAIKKGLLREDLFYRLSVFTLTLPALREHSDDIPLLAQHFLEKLTSSHEIPVFGIRDDAMDRLVRYHWPGNVRQLRNVVERAAILARRGWIEKSHLPPDVALGKPQRANTVVLPGRTAADTERELIFRTLEETGYNKTEAARRLDLDVKTIRNKLKSYGAL